MIDQARLKELAAQLPNGRWYYRRALTDGALLLYADDEALAHIYAGIDLAKYLVAVQPTQLLDR